MSLAGKMKEMEEVSAAQTEKVAELEASVTAKDAEIETMGAEHAAKVEEMQAKIDEMEAKELVYAEDLAVAIKDAEAKGKDLEEATAKLEDPAYKAAEAEGEDEAADATVIEEAEEIDPKEAAQVVVDEYLATEEGFKRSDWLTEHGAELQDAFNLLSVKTEEG